MIRRRYRTEAPILCDTIARAATMEVPMA